METLKTRVKDLEKWYDRQEEFIELKKRVLTLEQNLRAIHEYLDVAVIHGVQLKARYKDG